MSAKNFTSTEVNKSNLENTQPYYVNRESLLGKYTDKEKFN